MSWTGWVFEMNDGCKFNFGTTFLMEFFHLPEGYKFEDVAKIFNGSFLDDTGEVLSIRDNRERWLKWTASDNKQHPLHRERPYFVCYVE